MGVWTLEGVRAVPPYRGAPSGASSPGGSALMVAMARNLASAWTAAVIVVTLAFDLGVDAQEAIRPGIIPKADSSGTKS